MNVETLIYAYLAICVSMILFNCACVAVFRRRDAALRERSSSLEQTIMQQMERLKNGEHIEEAHKVFLRKSLRKVNHLLAFDETLDGLLKQYPQMIEQYLKEIYEVFLYLAAENPYKSNVKVTYFAYVIGKYKVMKGRTNTLIMAFMMRLLSEQSIYCRENALAAIYSSGNCEAVLQALRRVDESSMFHSQKLLTDGLLTFDGDHEQLAALLWKEWGSFSVQMKVVILDYIRFGGRNMQAELLPVMADERQNDEIRFCCIRYFGRYPYEPAYPLLLSFAESRREERWEYAAIASTALASYPSERSIEVLKHNLNHSNWYVRLNSVRSLGQFHLTYNELSDVLEGNDRYAREILQYQMDMQKLTESQGKKGNQDKKESQNGKWGEKTA